MRVEVINTGTELVLGRTLNTHLGYLGEKLFTVGLRIERQVCIPDGEVIGEELRTTCGRADVVLVTGGLGPTSDDLTREITAMLLRRALTFDQNVGAHIKAYYALRKRPFGEGGRRQSMVPEGAVVLWNAHGTAPGLYFPRGDENPHIFLLPGPPRELYPMMEAHVLPILAKIAGASAVDCREWKFGGLGESELAAGLESSLTAIPGLEIGYCAKPMEVHLRCLGSREALAEADAVVRRVYPHHVVSDDLSSQEEVVVKALLQQEKWVTVAESCTGGLISHRLTNVPGASGVLSEAHVTYSNQAKTTYLAVDPDLLQREGAVSAAVAVMMAEGALRAAHADYALAVTGIAGPGGGGEEKPAGTVFISLAEEGAETHVERDFFPTDRETFKWRVSQRALDLLRRRLHGYPPVSGFVAFLLTVLALLASATAPLQAEEEPDASPTDESSQVQAVKEELERSTRDLGAWVDEIGQGFGAEWLAEEIVLGINGVRIVASLALLLLVGAFTALMLHLIRRRTGRIRNHTDHGWAAMILAAVRKPLALVFWIYGIYFAFVLSVDAMDQSDIRRTALDWATTSTYVGLAVAVFWLLFRTIRGLEIRMRIWASSTGGVLDNVMVPLVGRSLRMLVPIVGLFLLIPALNLPPQYDWIIGKFMGMLLIGGVAYILIKAVTVTEKVLLQEHRLDVEDNLQARKIYTQVSVIRKIVVVTVSVVSVACALMLFDPVRQLGTSILASAGIAGIVLGFAAQKTLGNLLAGIQIALTQPIRIDDVVIVEGEWGRIEEITLSYVVLRIWDLRRLVVPINYFIDNAFQNWTRTSADILGTVFLYVDYSVPVDEIRKELRRLVDGNPLWDGNVCGLQVTNATENTVELRCLASSANASKSWDLRCQLREKLIAFVRERYPTALPKLRAEFRASAEENAETPPPASLSKQPEQEGSSHPGIDATTEPEQSTEPKTRYSDSPRPED